jgi:DNA adenine methylase
MRPPFTYYGGKIGMADRIIEIMPAHRVYIEPFLGSGAVFFAKPPVTHEILNDIDGAVVAFFAVLRERPEDLARVCRLTPYAREEYAAADCGAPGLDDLEIARRFWVRVNQSFAKTAGPRTGWSITTARTQSVSGSVAGRLDRFAACAERLSQAAIECCDGADLVARLATPDSVVYVDPPYLGTTRSGMTKRGDYRHEMGSREDHERLAEVLHRTPATVLLSGYPSPLYEDLYADWPRLETAVLAHSSNAVTSERGDRMEVLWMNRELDRGLFAVSHPRRGGFGGENAGLFQSARPAESKEAGA